MNTWHLHIKGQVQGVGFRPFIFALAHQFGLSGYVNNSVDGVHIDINADQKTAHEFKNQIIDNAPALSKITTINLTSIIDEAYLDFKIIDSEENGVPNLLITPDFALCSDCREELYDHKNRRHLYPFITCTNCGPRFSIIHKLPYDRVNTEMKKFIMCDECQKEYDDPRNRRYYSQTNSCPSCPIRLSLLDNNNNVITNNEKTIISLVLSKWKNGDIVAIKGLGGYLLTCDATNAMAIEKLRNRKKRPSKPFAMMYPEISAMKGLVLHDKAIKQLQNSIGPIVLVGIQNPLFCKEGIAPGLDQVGVMLPYTPLFDMLVSRFGRQIIATSGNLSNAPIAYKDEQAMVELSGIADYFLLNDREIVVPQDDSVIKFSFIYKKKIIIRRSRGMAPTFIDSALGLSNKTILALGGMLKSTFSLLQNNNLYLSQYIGDLQSFQTQQSFQTILHHFLSMLNTKPEVLLVDAHEGYPSSQYGFKLAEEKGIPLFRIQHHKAHFGAILGEHNLLEEKERILGVIWDGTGLGDDKNIWGGEFFIYEKAEIKRLYHAEYFDFILGDKMPKEPRISAFSLCNGIDAAELILKEKFSDTEWNIYQKLLGRPHGLKTSSIGRIFDAVASLLGVLDFQTYEGEAALRLETLAQEYFDKNGLDAMTSYIGDQTYRSGIPVRNLMEKLITDIKNEKSPAFIAAKFHYSLMKSIEIIAQIQNLKKITFSGGVFQNSVLVDLIIHHLSKKFELYFHERMSPNDECISFGQLMCYHIDQKKKMLENQKSINHVFSNLE